MNSEAYYDHLAKVVVIGDSNVGKSNVLLRFTGKRFMEVSKSTIGVELHIQNLQVTVDSVKTMVQIQVWDTAGQERFAGLVSSYYRGIHAALVVYDITKRESFTNVQKWLDQLRNYSGDNVITMLVGNKSDLGHKREVPTAEAVELAKANSLLFMETSALDDSNIKEAFMELACQFVRQNCKPGVAADPAKPNVTPGGIDLSEKAEPTKKKRCCW